MSINERKDKTGRIEEVDLGLPAHETQVLAECRAAIAGDELDDLRDATLARYLRHNSWKVEPAIKQLREYLAWRKANNVDRILDQASFPSQEVIRVIVPYAYHQSDREGRPIYIEKTGLIATAALADEKICNPEHFLHSHIYGVELMQQRMHEQSLKSGKRVNGICTILDFEGLGFHHRQCLNVLKRCLDFDKKYYPEYVEKLYIINSPWVGPYLYQAVQVFLDEITKARIQIISGDPSQFLLTQIAPENLPVAYGGNCTGVNCEHGGMGKNYPGVSGCVDVLDQSKLAAVEVSGLDQQDVSYDFEKEVGADAEGEVFTWYFEVAGDYDIDFSVELLPLSGVKEADESKRVLIHKVERLKTGKGTFKAPYANAKLLFRWDNNFSYFASKTVKYTVQCMKVTDNLDALVASAGSANEVAKADKVAKAKVGAGVGNQEQKGQ